MLSPTIRRLFALVIFACAVPCLSQTGPATECTPAGTWYGGSVTAYQLTIVPVAPAGHYSFIFQGMYKEPAPYVITAHPTGEIVKNGRLFEGPMLSLAADSSVADNPGTAAKMPDLLAGWVSMEMVDCNTIRNTIPFFGLYFASPTQLPPELFPPFGVNTPGIWLPGTPWTGVNWINGKVPFVDAPDVDMIIALTLDTRPIVETYHRLPATVNPALLHH